MTDDEFPLWADDIALKAQDCFRESQDAHGEWRDEAEKAYDYASGDQWSDEDVMRMDELGKPYITFNRTEIFISAVTGLEALNRNEVRFLPRKVGEDTHQADIWTAAAEYVNDDCDAEVHHSTAFRDLVICGMGWTDTKMNYETNPDGDVEIEWKDPRYMYWDSRANQRNLRDARWVMSVFPMSYEEVKQTWPHKLADVSFARAFDPDWEPSGMPHNANEAWLYANDQSRQGPRPGNDIWIAQYQWYEREMFYRVQFRDGVRDFPVAQWERYIEQIPALAELRKVGPFAKRHYKQALIAGLTVLEVTDLPSEDFTLQCMTGKHDRTKNIWYGIVRPLIDPQDWVNKLYSQILHIINTNAKGGLLAEKEAFDSVAKAEEDWASSDSITWLKPGAIKDNKIMPKPEAQYPVGLDRLLQFAMSMFQDVTGANLELLGLAEKVQPGVLEAQRKQAGMTILAWCFDSLRAYRKRHGRVLATFIREFIADGRLIRMVGKGGMEYVPLMQDKLALEYDIIVTESPQSTNERERTFAVLMELLPMMIEAGYQIPPDLADYMPLPGTLIEALKEGANDPRNAQMAEMMKQLEAAQKKADVAKTQAEAAYNAAKAQSETVDAMTGGS